MFILVQPTSQNHSQQQLLIHFFLSENKEKRSKDKDKQKGEIKKLKSLPLIANSNSSSTDQEALPFLTSSQSQSTNSPKITPITNRKLVMEIIGRSRPKKSVMNRQCLSDLIALTSMFIKKRKASERL